MLARLSRLLVLLGAAFAVTVAPSTTGVAWGQDDWGGDPFAEEEEEDEDYEQPPVTTGGLYTKETWPLAELERPLTITRGMLEARGGLDIDVGADTAFEIWRTRIDARYGLQDHVELQAGLDGVLSGELPMGSTLLSFFAGFEAAIAYDFIDFRALAIVPVDPDTKLDIAVGFPFRYKPKEKVAIVALDKLMTIHTDDRKPDLTIGVGIIYQAKERLALLLRGEVLIPQFDTDTANIAVPATAAIQYTTSRKVDIGGEFTFGNVNPPGEDASPFDRRSLLLYAQVRM